jgi:hypothetical protein
MLLESNHNVLIVQRESFLHVRAEFVVKGCTSLQAGMAAGGSSTLTPAVAPDATQNAPHKPNVRLHDSLKHNSQIWAALRHKAFWLAGSSHRASRTKTALHASCTQLGACKHHCLQNIDNHTASTGTSGKEWINQLFAEQNCRSLLPTPSCSCAIAHVVQYTRAGPA